MSPHEIYALAYLVKFPILIHRLNEELLSSQAAADFYAAIYEFERSSLNAIPMSAWHGYLQSRIARGTRPHFHEYDVEAIYRIAGTVANADHYGAILDDFHFSVNSLKIDRYIMDTARSIEEAKTLLLEHKPKDAIVKLRNIPFPSSGVRLKSTKDAMLESVDESNSFKTGIKAIDAHMGGLNLGNIVSIVGDTGSMKTKFSVWLCLQILRANPTFKCLYFEKEMPRKDLDRRLVTMLTGTAEKAITEAQTNEERKKIKQEIEEAFEKSAEWRDLLEERFFIIPTTEFRDASDIYEIVEQHRPQIWCLDYLTQLSDKKDREKNAFIMKQMETIKSIVHTTDSLCLLLNQCKKHTVDARKDKRPLMGDIEWSGDIKNTSAYVLANFYPGYYWNPTSLGFDMNYFYLIALKNRHEKKFVLPLEAEGAKGLFTEPDSEVHQKMMAWYEHYDCMFSEGLKS